MNFDMGRLLIWCNHGSSQNKSKMREFWKNLPFFKKKENKRENHGECNQHTVIYISECMNFEWEENERTD